MQGFATSLAVPDPAAFARSFRYTVKLPAGAAVYRCGDAATRLWVVVDGSVRLRFDGATNFFQGASDPPLGALGPGQTFGMEALHQHLRPRDHTAQVKKVPN